MWMRTKFEAMVYDRLCEALDEMGYTVNDEDKCVFNRMACKQPDNYLCHVDDLLMTCMKEKVMNLEIGKLDEIFGSLSAIMARCRTIWEWCLILQRKEQL